VDYRLAVDSEVLQLFLKLRRHERQQLLRWFERLKASPFFEGRERIVDHAGREIHVCVLPGLLVFHWTDHLEKTVNVVKVELR